MVRRTTMNPNSDDTPGNNHQSPPNDLSQEGNGVVNNQDDNTVVSSDNDEEIQDVGHQFLSNASAQGADGVDDDESDIIVLSSRDDEEYDGDHSDDMISLESEDSDDMSSLESEEVQLPILWIRRLERGALSFLPYVRRYARRFMQDDDLQPNAERPENITFDQNLPTAHSYLGEMDECSGVQYVEQESFLVIPILQFQNLMLVPGQTLPLDVSAPQQLSLLRNVMCREDKTFGVVLSSFSEDLAPQVSVDYGCTAELRSMREEEVNEVETMVGIAIGRQRFQILERRTQPDGNLVAKVKILNDDEISPPASGAMLNTHRKCISNGRYAQKQQKYCRTLLSAGFLTKNPPWVYKMYDVNCLRKCILEELRDWYPEVDNVTLPASPSAFSFWIVSHCIMTNAMRLTLLKIDSSVQRLRCELDILRKFTICTCIGCGNHITQRRHIFNMSVSGPMNAYVNPSGHIHETLTVYSAKGLLRVSNPSEQHSWFPGYSWTICQCDSCGSHIGWKFIATKSSLVPKVFWGLTRSSLHLHMETEDSTAERSSRQRRYTDNSVPRESSQPGGGWRPML